MTHIHSSCQPRIRQNAIQNIGLIRNYGLRHVISIITVKEGMGICHVNLENN